MRRLWLLALALVAGLLLVGCAGQERFGPTDGIGVPIYSIRPIYPDSTEWTITLAGTPYSRAEIGVDRGFVTPSRFRFDGQGLALVRWRFPNLGMGEDATLSDCTSGVCYPVIYMR